MQATTLGSLVASSHKTQLDWNRKSSDNFFSNYPGSGLIKVALSPKPYSQIAVIPVYKQ